jgi:hypothetical protein
VVARTVPHAGSGRHITDYFPFSVIRRPSYRKHTYTHVVMVVVEVGSDR